MSTDNGRGDPQVAAIGASGEPSSPPARSSAGAIGGVPVPRFPPRVLQSLALVLTALPLVLWGLLAIPRAIEITGAAEGSGGEGGEDLYVGLMLASISIIVSLLAVTLSALSDSDAAERVAIEHEETERLKVPMLEAEHEAYRAAEERNRAFGATDALVGTYSDGLAAIESHFFEGFYRRHAQDPEVYGTWDDLETVARRFKWTFDELFRRPDMLTAEELAELIERDRATRANMRDPRGARVA